MLNPIYRNHFEKDVKLAKKQGKQLSKLRLVMQLLIEQKPLTRNYQDHALVGNYKGRRECHIEPNWLLIYKIDKNDIIFERTGSHSDLF